MQTRRVLQHLVTNLVGSEGGGDERSSTEETESCDRKRDGTSGGGRIDCSLDIRGVRPCEKSTHRVTVTMRRTLCTLLSVHICAAYFTVLTHVQRVSREITCFSTFFSLVSASIFARVS